MTSPTLLYSGFDTLDIAFPGCLPARTIKQLKSAKEEAQKTNNPVTIDLGPGKIPVQVLGGGRGGGYAFQVNTGPVGAIYAFKDSQSATDWNIFVNIGSAMLLELGYHGAKERILADLKGFGSTFGQESINRADYCFDYGMEDFELNKDQIVAPPQSKIACHHGPKEQDDHPLLVFSGRKVKTLTVGMMPNRQIQIYDKRQEVISRRKLYWFDVWGTDRTDKAQQVWRIEVRAGKSHLLRWGGNTPSK